MELLVADVFDQVAGHAPAQPPQQAQPTQAAQPSGDVFDQVAANPNLAYQTSPAAAPVDQEQEASKNRMEALSGMTGMPVAGQDKAEFEKGKTAGMVSGLATVPAVAGATAAAPAVADTAQLASEYAEFFGKQGAQKLMEMAAQHPEATKTVLKIVGGALAGHEMGKTTAGALIGLLMSRL